MEKLLVSISDAAKALSLGRTSIYELMRSGELETRKRGAAAPDHSGFAPAAGGRARLGAGNEADQSASGQASSVL